MGFEPTRAEHNGLAVHRLNHSATSSHISHSNIDHSGSNNYNYTHNIRVAAVKAADEKQDVLTEPIYNLQIRSAQIFTEYF